MIMEVEMIQVRIKPDKMLETEMIHSYRLEDDKQYIAALERLIDMVLGTKADQALTLITPSILNSNTRRTHYCAEHCPCLYEVKNTST